MSEFERAFALLDRITERTAERLEPTPFGPVVVHSRVKRIHDLNFLRADEHGDATARNSQPRQQLLEHRRDVCKAVATHLFAAEVDGKLVAHADLYCEDGVGQVENVFTLPDYRGRGLARSLVLHAVAESHAAGNELTFLVADAGAWPQRLYEKLGFETVGRYARFLKPRAYRRERGPQAPFVGATPRP